MLYLANPCGNEEITAAMADGVIGVIDTAEAGEPAAARGAVVCRQRLFL